MHQQLLDLAGLIPDDKWDWSPKPGLWSSRAIMLHIAEARHQWLRDYVRDGEQMPDVPGDGETREGVRRQLQLSWDRLDRFLSDPDKLAATYRKWQDFTGHWLAYHLLEHDVHHRADIFHYLALLGVKHGDVETP
jgi:uncharacterized damage-inducible protein DinB